MNKIQTVFTGLTGIAGVQGAPVMLNADPTVFQDIIGTVVQVVIGICTIIAFFKKKKPTEEK